jgi:hypothetical protein
MSQDDKFDQARSVFLGELHFYLALSEVDPDIKRQEIEATITAIRGLDHLINRA